MSLDEATNGRYFLPPDPPPVVPPGVKCPHCLSALDADTGTCLSIYCPGDYAAAEAPTEVSPESVLGYTLRDLIASRETLARSGVSNPDLRDCLHYLRLGIRSLTLAAHCPEL